MGHLKTPSPSPESISIVFVTPLTESLKYDLDSFSGLELKKKNWTGTWCWADQAQASRWPLSASSCPRSSFLQNSDFSTAPPSERVMFIACFKDKGNHKLCLMLMRNGCLASYDVGDISHCTDRDSPELRVFSSLFSAAWKWKVIFLKKRHTSTLLQFFGEN